MNGCSITIDGISGQLVAPPCQTLVTVWGQVVGSCSRVDLKINCSCGGQSCQVSGSVDANGVTTGGATGYLANGSWQVALQTNCCCDATVDINVMCMPEGCQTSHAEILRCNPCCPAITPQVEVGPCQPSGSANVAIGIHVAQNSGCQIPTVELDFGDGTAPQTITGPFPVSPTHVYPSGNHLALITVLSPNACPPIGVPIHVNCPQVGCCPQLSTTAGYGDCTASGASQVTLTTSFSVPPGCPPATVHIDFGDGGPLSPPHTISGTGQFIETRTYSAGPHNGLVIVTSPANCIATPFAVNVPCPPRGCCPTLVPLVGYGACEAGASAVTMTVYVTLPAGCPPVTLQVDFDDGSWGQPHVLGTSGSFTETHSYPTGSYNPVIHVTNPAGCPVHETALNVQCPAPECCPEISTKADVGGCDGNGNATVTVDVAVTPATGAGCPPAQVQVNFGGGDIGPVHTFAAPGTFSETRNYAAGMHSATVEVVDPPGCESEQVTFAVTCPDCCPDVTMTPCIPDCDNDANRTVEFAISVTPKPPPCPPTAVEVQMDFGDGSKGQLVTVPAGAGGYSYTESHVYSGSAALQSNTASVTVFQPRECAGDYSAKDIPPCCTKKKADWCELLFLTMSWAFTLAILFLLLWIWPPTPPQNPPSTYCQPAKHCLPFNLSSVTYKDTFWILAAITVVSIIIYWLLCRKCRCEWFLKLLWRALSGAGLLYAIHAFCIHRWWTVLIGAILILLAFLCLQAWKKKCCVSPCPYLAEILIWLGVNILTVVSFMLGAGIGKDCHFDLVPPQAGSITITVYQVAVLVLAALTASYVAQCGGQERR